VWVRKAERTKEKKRKRRATTEYSNERQREGRAEDFHVLTWKMGESLSLTEVQRRGENQGKLKEAPLRKKEEGQV